MHFTLTNDDGYEARGLAVLAEVARRLGTVDIVAPHTPQSQTSHAVSMSRPLALRTLNHGPLGAVTVVVGRPADCTRLAIAGLAGSRRPDWVLSGINHGGNLGVDLFYSGTVAAAREAALYGVPAASFSQLIREPLPIDWAGAAVMVERALRQILAWGCPPHGFYNVNLPAIADGFDSTTILESPVAADPLPLTFDPMVAPDGAGPGPDLSGFDHYRYTGRYAERRRTPGTDVDATFAGHISISRLRALT